MILLKKYRIILFILIALVLIVVFFSTLKEKQGPTQNFPGPNPVETPNTPLPPFIVVPNEKPTEVAPVPVSQITSPSEAEELAKGDLKFADGAQAFLEEYPWYPSLPIDTSSYRIVYDLERESFRIRLKVAPTTPKSQQDLIVAQAIKDAESYDIYITDNYYVLFGN